MLSIRIEEKVTLLEAFSLSMGDVVCIVGAGGKTTVLYSLATELRKLAMNVIATTTTRMQISSNKAISRSLFVREEHNNWVIELEKYLSLHGLATLVEARERDDKLIGIHSNRVVDISHLAEYILIEGDGARSRSLKAPAGHEPVIPIETTVCVLVVGFDVLGEVMNKKTVHRLDIVRKLSGVKQGGLVTDSVIVDALVKGYLPKLTTVARTIVFLNKVSRGQQESAIRLGKSLLRNGISEVVLGEAAETRGPFVHMCRLI